MGIKGIYTPTEKEVFKIIQRHRAGVNTKMIAEKLYKNKTKPTHYRMVVSNMVNRIKKKADMYGVGYKIYVENFGRNGKMVWFRWVK